MLAIRAETASAAFTFIRICSPGAGENAYVNFDELVRKVVNEIGYDSSEKGFDGNTCAVLSVVASQSADIALGVDHALEDKSGEMKDAGIEHVGAGDQGMMFGFACNETSTLMPMPIYMADKLAHRLSELRKDGTLPWLRPDGKSQVTVEYSQGQPKRSDTVLISTQHSPDISQSEIMELVSEHIIYPTLPKNLVDKNLKIFVNPTGRFVIGGPQECVPQLLRMDSSPRGARCPDPPE